MEEGLEVDQVQEWGYEPPEKESLPPMQVDIPEQDERGNTIVMAWISVKDGWSCPIDLGDVQGEVNNLRRQGHEFEIHWVADAPTYGRYDRIRNKEIV